MLLLQLFDQFKEEANRLVVTFDSQLHVASIVLNNFHIHELMTETLNYAEERAFDEYILRDLVESELMFEDLCCCSFLRFIISFCYLWLVQSQNGLN